MISTKDVHFTYKCGSKILNGVDLNLPPGEIVGILGPNGSGKSTLLKNIQLFLKPDSGEINYFNLNHNEIKISDLAKKMSLVPQVSSGGKSLSVKDMVLLGRLPHLESKWHGFSKHDHNIVDKILTNLKLKKFKERLCITLSGGEFQKVMLARALAQESSVLLLDEATANLDMNHSVEIMELVKKRAKSGVAVAAVLHDLNLAAAYCDRIIFMHKGRIYKNDTPLKTFTPEIIEKIYGFKAYVDYDNMGVPFVLPRKALIK